MTAPAFDLSPFLRRDEGQHFDRKSMFEGEPGRKRPRDRRVVRDQVAEYVAAFANAEGGVLVLGIEDDQTVTGHSLPQAALAALLEVPKTRLQPPQQPGFVVREAGRELIVFDVPACDVPVMVQGDGFPLRMGDKTVQVAESYVRQLKFRGLVESWESRPSHMRLDDLDRVLLERARTGGGLVALSDEAYLIKRKLADYRGRDLVLRRAAELLFATDGPDHPNAGFRLFRVVGSERRVGAAHNVEERPRFEGNLPAILEACFAAVDGIIRRPARLVGHHFRTVPEYPEFAWKEAIVNAAAHRDYNVEGRTTEIWFFDDRLEVVSPGGLLPDVNLEALLALERIHVSRNPRTARVLVELGIMRDQGEGIPRMFAEMEGLFLPAPSLQPTEHQFRVTLRNTPTLSSDDHDFVTGLSAIELTDLEFRALLEAHRVGRLDNSRLRSISGLDTLGASALLRRLRDRDLLALHPAGAASYYELGPKSRGRAPKLDSQTRKLDSQTHKLEGQTHKLGGQTHKLDGQTHKLEGQTHKLDGQTERPRSDSPPQTAATHASSSTEGSDQRVDVATGSGRSSVQQVREAVVALCEGRWWTATELAAALNRKDAATLARNHLRPLVAEGGLELRFPQTPTHPRQAYRASRSA